LSTDYKPKPSRKDREHNQTVASIWSSVIATVIVETVVWVLMYNHRTLEMLWPVALGPLASIIAYWRVSTHYWKRANKTRIDQNKKPKKKGKPNWVGVRRCLLASVLYVAAMLAVAALPITDGPWLWTHRLGWFFGPLLYLALGSSYWSVNYYLVRGRPQKIRMSVVFAVSVIGMIVLDSARYYFWMHP
jgi:hypothetical protein